MVVVLRSGSAFGREQKYAAQAGPHQQRAQEIYAELRKNIVDNVHKVRCGAAGRAVI